MKKALVCGAGGFIGTHLVRRLKKEGYWVRGVDIQKSIFSETSADEFYVKDLVNRENCVESLNLPNEEVFDEVYQLAADMGGAGYIFTGENDLKVMHDSVSINLNFINLHKMYNKIFYSSSACIYPENIQMDPKDPGLRESTAYPANPDSEYGWEKLFSERLYLALMKKTGKQVRIARFHNIFGPEGTWEGGKEKAPAAMCRKVAECEDGGEIEIWGDGEQTRSFLYIDECLEGIRRLMESEFIGPVNIGSDEMISINGLALMTADIAGKKINLNHIEGPLGVRGRNSENTLIQEKLGWRPSHSLKDGMEKTCKWITEQVEKKKSG